MAFALPTIQKGQAPSKVATDPRLPVQEAKARTAMFSAIGAPIAEAGQRYAEREGKREMQEAVLYAHDKDASFVAQYGGKEEFSVMDIDDSNFMDLADGMGYEDPSVAVPSYRIYSEWRQKNYQDALEEASGKITNASDRETFTSKHKMKGLSNYAEDSVRASKSQVKYMAKKTMGAVEQSLLKRDYSGARIAVATSGMSGEAQASASKAIDTREQTDYFNSALKTRNIDGMTKALEQLQQNDPKTTSMIDEESQKVFSNQLRTAINTENNAVSASVTSHLKLTRDHLERQIKDVWKGKPVDVASLVANAKALSVQNPVLVQEAKWTVNNQPVISGVLMQSPSVQVATLKQWTDESTGGMEDSYRIDQLQKAIAYGQNARKTDSLKWAKEVNFVVTSPMDYSSFSSIKDSLEARVKPIISIQGKYGTFTGFLTEGELVEFGSKLENSPNKLEFFASINSGLGEYAEPFYEQLKKYGVSGTAAVAGQVLSRGEGYRTVADNILKGSGLRKDNLLTQQMMKERKPELDPFIVQNFGGLYTGNLKQQSIMAEAFKDLYAVTGDKDASFRQLTGGVIDYNDYNVQAPIPGMSGFQYKMAVKDWDKTVWASSNMQAYGYTPDQLMKSVIDGSLKQEGLGAGVSHLVASDGTLVKRKDGTTPLQFVFDINYPTKSSAKTKAERADKQKQATSWARGGDR